MSFRPRASLSRRLAWQKVAVLAAGFVRTWGSNSNKVGDIPSWAHGADGDFLTRVLPASTALMTLP